MGVTQKDIARRLNLSQSLVARVLGNSADVWVSAENRRLIHVTARELGYQPNSAARMLRTGKAYAVSCCYVNSAGSAGSYSAVIEACAEELGRMDYELKVKVYSDHERLMGGLQHLASARSSDAVILWGSEPRVEEQGELLAELGVPFVLKGRHEERHPEWLQVDFDHEGMMRRAVDFCVDSGRKRIAYIGHENDEAYAVNLRKGFRQAIDARQCQAVPDDHFLALGEDVTTRAKVNAAIDGWFAKPAGERPDAIVFGAGSRICRNAEFALHRHGMIFGDAPGEMMVTGMDYPGGELIYGRAWNFPSVMSDTLAHAMVTKLLVPVLKGETPPVSVYRILPELTRTPPSLTDMGNE